MSSFLILHLLFTKKTRKKDEKIIEYSQNQKEVYVQLSSIQSLPLLVIFERHWDETPKLLLQDLVPNLAAEGYDTICYETRPDRTEDEILDALDTNIRKGKQLDADAKKYLARGGIRIQNLAELQFERLSELMQFYVSSQRYAEVSEIIKDLPAVSLLKETLTLAKKHSFSIKGIDSDNISEIVALNLGERLRAFDLNEEKRINSFVVNIKNLTKDKKGLIFFCGASHAEALVKKLKVESVDKVLYYFPHSGLRYAHVIDEIKDLSDNDTLRTHTYCIMENKDRKSLGDRIIAEIKTHNKLLKQT